MKNFVKRAIHLDFHTMPKIYDVGAEFDPKEFATTLKNAHIDYITIFARCNLGFTYYPTKVGIIHPGMQTEDMLGGMVKACHKEGIKVAAYINAGLDHQHALLHREWCQVSKDGLVYDIKLGGSFFRRMCLNSGYRQHLLSMIEEVLTKYPVDGLFLDCFSKAPCYGVECLESMEKLGMDISDETQVTDYTFMQTMKFQEEVVSLAKKKRGDIFFCFNGLPYSSQPTHTEIEVLPPAWGYDYFPWAGRYARTLNKPFIKMTGRFHKSWGDFGGLRPEESLLFDCYNAIANGGTCSIGDHMHPRGRLDPEVYRVIGNVYSKIEELEPWTYGATPTSEMAILLPEAEQFPAFLSFNARKSIAGAARMLMELKYQFDIIDNETKISSKYKIIFIPEDVLINKSLKKKLKEYLSQGGSIISAGSGGLDENREKFALEEYKLSYLGEEEHNPSFFKAEKKVSHGLPDMLITIYDKGVAIKAEKGAEVLCKLFQPYFNVDSWDMKHWHRYTPPEKDTKRPALVRCGNIFHFSFPIFFAYNNHAVVAYKQLLDNCIKMVLPKPLIKVKNLPSFAQVTVTKKDKFQAVHILSYLPEKRGETTQMIEEPICLKNLTLGLRKDGKDIKQVYLAPSRKPIDFKDDQDYIWIKIPEVEGYSLTIFE
jgi:hypothetical protein